VIAGVSGDPSDSGAGPAQDAGPDDAEPSDDDILFEEDAPSSTRTAEEQIAALRKSNNRLRRRFAKAKPIVDRVRDLNLDELTARARQYDALEEAARRNPRLRALLYNDSDDPADTPAERPASSSSKLPPLPAEFTAESLGFDPAESTANRVLATAIQHVAALSQQVATLQRLQPTVQSLERDVRARTATEEAGAWRAALTSLEEKLKAAAPGNELVVTLARDAFVGAYQTRGSHRRSPQQVVDHYLGQLAKAGQISKKTQQVVSAGVQSRIAEHNRSLPKSPAGGGSPAPAAGNTRPTLKDIHRKLRTMG
jgi:hypothetical protein